MGNQFTSRKHRKFIIGGIFVVVAVYLLCGASYIGASYIFYVGQAIYTLHVCNFNN